MMNLCSQTGSAIRMFQTTFLSVNFLSLLLFSLLTAQTASAQLAKEAQADLKQQQIIRTVQQGQFSQAYQQFKEYDALGVKMPTPLLFIRAQVSFKANDFVGTKAYLEQYINNAQRGTANYNKALSMYTAVEPKAAQQATQLAEQQRLAKAAKEKAERDEKAKAASARIQAKVNALKQSGQSFLPEMISIPAGQFQMGSTDYSHEQPVHTVTISAFKLASTETTQALWETVMGDNPSNFSGENRPVERVSWNDIQEFIAVLNSATGQNYRLPTESEWEYAARAGTTTKYSWGNRASKRKANYGVGSYKGTKSVKSYKPNKWGLYDMHGNVWEWVQDCYSSDYFSVPNDGRAKEVESCDERVRRGGSWFYDANDIRSAYRGRNSPSYWVDDIGFRLAQDN